MYTIRFRDSKRIRNVLGSREGAPKNSNGIYSFMCWAEQAVLGSAKTVLKFKYEI